MQSDRYSQADIDDARQVARNLWEKYNSDKISKLQGIQVGKMLCGAYNSIDKVIQPTQLDVDSYSRILDRNGDGCVTLSDLETLCIRYLVKQKIIFSPLKIKTNTME